MFERIMSITKNYAIVKVSNNINDDILNYNVILEDMNKKILGEIEEVREDKVKITFLGEFINDNFYMLKSTIALGDYYYNDKKLLKECLIEYFKALVLAENTEIEVNINKIKERIDDMKLRMTPEEFTSIENKYGKRN